MIDDAIGSILGWLKTLRLDDDTVVIFTSDHGDFMGDHQLLLKGALHYRGLVRVPCIWSDPAKQSTGTINSNLCGTIDSAPTILDRAGLAGHNGIQGKSLLPALAGAPTGHESMLVEEHQRRGYMGLANNFRARSLITKQHRLTIYEGVYWGELYDFSTDPHELDNLWNEPSAQPIRQELTEQLARKMMEMTETSPAYHGDTVGAVSLGHIDLFHKAYSGLLFKTDRVMAPYCYRCLFNRARPERADARDYRQCNWECLDKLELKFAAQAKSGNPYAAFVFEPLMQGAAGMIPQPAGWLRRAARERSWPWRPAGCG